MAVSVASRTVTAGTFGPLNSLTAAVRVAANVVVMTTTTTQEQKPRLPWVRGRAGSKLGLGCQPQAKRETGRVRVLFRVRVKVRVTIGRMHV